jgi:hypothetical protein
MATTVPPTTGECSVPTDAWKVVLDSISDVETYRQYRHILYDGAWEDPIGCSHDRIRVRLKNIHGTKTTTLDGCSIGIRSGSTVDFSGAPTRVTFDNGNNGVTIPAASEVVSDWISYTLDPDANDYLVHIFIHNVVGQSMSSGPQGVDCAYYKNANPSVDDTMTADVTDAEYTITQSAFVLLEIEVVDADFVTTVPPTTAPPTTVAPTTVSPTTFLTTPPPTTAPPTTVAPTTVAPTTATPPDHLVIVVPTVLRADPLEVEVTLHGSIFTQSFAVSPLEVTVTLHGSIVEGIMIYVDPLEVEVTLYGGDAVLGDYGDHRAKWSKVGYLDFTIDESNVAGERPMDWKGQIYDIRNLANKNPVYYGQNGVTLLKPSGVHMGMETIYRLGVKNKGATAGDERFHFFIDVLNQLWMLSTEGLVRLDYSEFISQMTTPIMSYDKEQELLYICDGTYGYIYGVRSKSFGEGPVNVTGIDSQGGTLYVTADDVIDTPKFEICTDIYDFGTRKFKTIQSIEVGSDLTEHLHASADYRVSYNDDFRQIPWFLVNPNGRAHPKCYGVEFRFRLRSFIYEYFEIDYLKVRGHIHGYSYLDTTVEKSGAAE